MKTSLRLWLTSVAIALLASSYPLDTRAANSGAQKQALHRVDFRIEGASCVMCLRRIAKTFRQEKGVAKADVSVFRPYWAIIIYDANQTNMQKLTSSIKGEHVRLAEIDDTKIDSIPDIIIPKGMVPGKQMPALKDDPEPAAKAEKPRTKPSEGKKSSAPGK